LSRFFDQRLLLGLLLFERGFALLLQHDVGLLHLRLGFGVATGLGGGGGGGAGCGWGCGCLRSIGAVGRGAARCTVGDHNSASTASGG
jgi:hypothetical protein